MNTFPPVSIIIPVKPGGKVKALEALNRLDYPKDKLEVFIAEGKQPSRQRNEAVKWASSEIIYFLDDDACPAANNIHLILEQFQDPAVAVVGGPSIAPASDSFIQKCFAAIFISPFGGAGIRNRYRSTGEVRDSSEKELILCNLAFRREIFNEMGRLNEDLYPNEENELMAKVKDSAFRIIHHPQIIVLRSQRKNIWLFTRQIFNYGRGRMEQAIMYPASFSFAHFIPTLFLIYLASLFFIGGLYYRMPLIAYLLTATFFGILSAGKSYKSFICIFSLFPLMHLSYGAGVIWGGIRYFKKKKRR